MAFKENTVQFQMIDIALIEPDPAQARQHIDEASLKGLANSIQQKGLIHPLVVQPANAAGRHRLIVGERRWRAAALAGETMLPALIRACDPDEIREVQIFENMGLGLRAALEPRDMAKAIHRIAERFDSPEAAAEHFGRSAAWLNQATAAAKLSPKLNALLDSGKISSTGTALQLEKLAQKNEARAESLIEQIEQQADGEKLSRKMVDGALAAEGGRRKKKDEVSAMDTLKTPAAQTSTAAALASTIPPWEEIPATPQPGRHRVNPGKISMVARILGLSGSDEEEILVRLIDEFLTLKGENA